MRFALQRPAAVPDHAGHGSSRIAAAWHAARAKPAQPPRRLTNPGGAVSSHVARTNAWQLRACSAASQPRLPVARTCSALQRAHRSLHPGGQVNADAPTYQTPAGTRFRPHLATDTQQSSATSGSSQQSAAASGSSQRSPSAPATAGASGSAKARRRRQSLLSVHAAAWRLGTSGRARGAPGAVGEHMVRIGCAPQALAGSTNIVSTRNLDNELISGDYISVINGVRISTPFFGTAYNFCIGARINVPAPGLAHGCEVLLRVTRVCRQRRSLVR